MQLSQEAKIGSLWKEDPGITGRSWKRRCLLLDGVVPYSFRQAPNLAPLGRIDHRALGDADARGGYGTL